MIVLPRARVMPPDLAVSPRLPPGLALGLTLGFISLVAVVDSAVVLAGAGVLAALALAWAGVHAWRWLWSLRYLAVLALLAWVAALLRGDPQPLWTAASVSGRLVLVATAAYWLFRVTPAEPLAHAMDGALARLGVRADIAALLPPLRQAWSELRDRLQTALFALALRGGPRRRNPLWWVAQLPRLIAMLLVACERAAYRQGQTPPDTLR